jgi:hypothetical protein
MWIKPSNIVVCFVFAVVSDLHYRVFVSSSCPAGFEHRWIAVPACMHDSSPPCSETEIKQLKGWKATVENLMERFDDLIKQQLLLQGIDEGQAALHGLTSGRAPAAGATPQGPAAEAAAAAADAAAAAIAAEEGAAGPLAAGGVVSRSSVLTPQHHVQINKLRWAALHPELCTLKVAGCLLSAVHNA